MARRGKKPKTCHSQNGGLDLERVCDEAWKHFQSYLDNEEDSDELGELIDLIRPHVVVVDHHPSHQQASAIDLSQIKTRVDLLPALLSVASSLLAEIHISEYLTLQPSVVRSKGGAGADNDNNNNNKKESRLSELRGEIHKCVQDAMCVPNPGCWSMVANFWRMLNSSEAASASGLSSSSSSSSSSSLGRIAQWYLHAADRARSLREGAIRLLESQANISSEEDEGSDCLDNDTLAWVECLVLNHMVGVELEGDSDSEDDDDDDERHSGADVGKPDQWSGSMVEATSRFMAAMLLSTLQDHEGALEQLRHLDVTHRIHPNVWTGNIAANRTTNGGDVDTKIRLYSTGSGAEGNRPGFLPSDVHERLCQAFAPDAPYWDETDYSNRGYYSYFSDLDAPRPNLIHQVVVEHLLPAAISQRSKADNDKDPIVGYEWWVHTRPVHASLGHNLHFDTDEATLNRSGQIYHPLCSSVVYLTGDPKTAGATIVFEQTPDASTNAARCWRNVPVPNSVLFFPGNLLHGVLPCPGKRNSSEGRITNESSSVPEISELEWLVTTGSGDANNQVPHRLTLLVGFWTRRIPDLVETRLYGPCGPLPKPDEFKWVEQLCRGYESTLTTSNSAAQVGCPPYESVPCITLAWEAVRHDPIGDDVNTTEGPPRLLPIPMGMLDHRYFVKDAPQCFYDALFDKDDDDGNDDNEDSGEASDA